MIEWIPRIIYNYLLELKEPLTILHVGGRKWSFVESDLVDYRHYTSVNSTDYNRMIHCADMFCGTNQISVTLSRAALCGIPVVLFQNDKYIDFRKLNTVVSRMPEWYQHMAMETKKVLPFRVFPWGWYRFLEPVMRDNGYCDLFDEVPIFQPKKCIDILHRNLFDDGYREKIKLKRDEYIKLLKSLTSPSKIWELI